MKTSEKEGVSDRPPTPADQAKHVEPQATGDQFTDDGRSLAQQRAVHSDGVLPFCSPVRNGWNDID